MSNKILSFLQFYTGCFSCFIFFGASVTWTFIWMFAHMLSVVYVYMPGTTLVPQHTSHTSPFLRPHKSKVSEIHYIGGRFYFNSIKTFPKNKKNGICVFSVWLQTGGVCEHVLCVPRWVIHFSLSTHSTSKQPISCLFFFASL